MVSDTPIRAYIRTNTSKNWFPGWEKYGKSGNNTASSNTIASAIFGAHLTPADCRIAAGIRTPRRSGTAAPSAVNTRAMARPRNKMTSKIATKITNSQVPALVVCAKTTWYNTPRATPPPTAAGIDTKAPIAAAPMVSMSRYGPAA